MSPHDGLSRKRSSFWIIVMLVYSSLAITALGWYVYDSYQSAKVSTLRDLRLIELRGVILHLDEILTMSAKMAAATGDSSWEQRYRHHESLLDRAIQEVVQLAPGVYEESAVGQTDAANRKLVDMENEAFSRVRQGNAPMAWTLLKSPEYNRQKKIYADGMRTLAEAMKRQAGTSLITHRQKAWLATGAMAVMLPSLLLLCGWVWRALNQRDVLGHRVQTEIAARQKMEHIAVQSEKLSAIGQLAAGVAHEINNPLGIILGFAQGLKRRIAPGDALEMPIHTIEREAIRCQTLVRDLLTFSRTHPEAQQRVDLNEAVESSLTLIQTKARLAGIFVEMMRETNLPFILGNKSQLQQVVINLATNAIDAMKVGGRLRLATGRAENPTRAFLKVTDNGSGIPPELLPRIYEPFFTTKPVGKGTGLGLSLVFDLVQKHSGQIDVQSNPRGTEFCIHFPEAIHHIRPAALLHPAA